MWSGKKSHIPLFPFDCCIICNAPTFPLGKFIVLCLCVGRDSLSSPLLWEGEDGQLQSFGEVNSFHKTKQNNTIPMQYALTVASEHDTPD